MKTEAQTSLARYAAILRLVARSPNGLAFNELRRMLDRVAPATLSRMLKALCGENLLKHDSGTGRYVGGGELTGLARDVLGSPSREECIRGALRGLAEATGQSALYMETDGAPVAMRMRYVDKEVVEGSVAYGALGVTKFVLAQGFGLGLMVQYDGDVVDAIVKEHVRQTNEDPRAISRDLDRLHNDGVVARPERFNSSSAGATRVVSPVRVDGSPCACIGITAFGQTTNVLDEPVVARWCTEVRHQAVHLSDELSKLKGA